MALAELATRAVCARSRGRPVEARKARAGDAVDDRARPVDGRVPQASEENRTICAGPANKNYLSFILNYGIILILKQRNGYLGGTKCCRSPTKFAGCGCFFTKL